MAGRWSGVEGALAPSLAADDGLRRRHLRGLDGLYPAAPRRRRRRARHRVELGAEHRRAGRRARRAAPARRRRRAVAATDRTVAAGGARAAYEAHRHVVEDALAEYAKTPDYTGEAELYRAWPVALALARLVADGVARPRSSAARRSDASTPPSTKPSHDARALRCSTAATWRRRRRRSRTRRAGATSTPSSSTPSASSPPSSPPCWPRAPSSATWRRCAAASASSSTWRSRSATRSPRRSSPIELALGI